MVTVYCWSASIVGCMLTKGRYYSYFWWHNFGSKYIWHFLFGYCSCSCSSFSRKASKVLTTNASVTMWKGCMLRDIIVCGAVWCVVVYVCCIRNTAHACSTSDFTSEQIKNGKKNLLGAQWKLNEDRATRTHTKKKLKKLNHHQRTLCTHTFKISIY